MNPQTRDDAIIFYEPTHSYRILTDPDHQYISVTTWINTFFEPFDADKVLAKMKNSPKWPKSPYFGMTDEEIKSQWERNKDDAVDKGVRIHDLIDRSAKSSSNHNSNKNDNNSEPELNDSWKYYEDFTREHPDWTLEKTEWRIFDEGAKIAGTIDALYKTAEGEWIIVDWKRCKKIVKDHHWPDRALPWPICQLANTNFNHYSLQLNCYKYILQKHYGIKVGRMFIVDLHPDYVSEEGRCLAIPDLQAPVGVLFANRQWEFSSTPN